MRRRDFVAALGGATVARALVARAQAGKTYRLGYLTGRVATDPDEQRRTSALVQALVQLGWIDGRNLRIDYRWAAGDTDRARAYAKQLVGLSPDLILAATTVALRAVRQETQTVPIVFVLVADPVGQGIVASLAHPGGGMTGFSAFDPAMGSKWLELLKEIAPGISRIAVMFNPDTAPLDLAGLRVIEAAAASFAVTVSAAFVHDASGIDAAIPALAREPNSGLIVLPDPFTIAHRERITSLVLQHRLPAAYGLPEFAANGGLICYGPDAVEQYRLAAGYIDRILKGAKPGDLPVQAPVNFQLIVNLKTAKALGLSVPTSLLAIADEVIE